MGAPTLSSLLLALALSASAQELTPAPYRNFSGGLNDSTAEAALPPEDSPALQNVVIDEPAGSLKPRSGSIQCGVTPSGSVATALFEYVKTNGTHRLIVSDNANYWQTADCVTFTRFRDGLSATARPSFTIARDTLWVASRSTIPFTWDGSTTTVLDGGPNTPSPFPPACSYLEYWLDRVWCARTDAEPSAVYFSALTDSAGNILSPSTGSASWPATNAIYIDRDGGSPIYGIKAYRNNLYVFKDKGIWRIVFRNDFDIQVVKTLSSVGSRFHTAIVEVDGLLYFVGPDGIYAFDGDQSIRISDKINGLFGSLKQPQVNELSRIWTSQTDFAAGTTNNTSVYDTAAQVALSSSVFRDDFADANYSANPAWTVGSGSWQVSYDVTFASQALSPAQTGTNEIYAVQTISTGSFTFAAVQNGTSKTARVYFMCSGSASSSCSGYDVTLGYNSLGNEVNEAINRVDAGAETNVCNITEAIGSGNLRTYTVKRTAAGEFTLSRDGSTLCTGTDTTYNTSKDVVINVNTSAQSFGNFYFYAYGDSGTWTSEIYNAATLSSYGAFNATSLTNGGTLSYKFRSSNSDAGVSAAPYVSVSPGVVASTTTHTRFQIQATLTFGGNDRTLSPTLYDATVNYTQGGVSSQTIHGVAWKNRVWFSASTGTATNDIVLVKTKLPLNAWVPYDLKVGPMVKFNDLLYAAASTHSAISRLDYGTNDNGDPITWYWTSRSETWGAPNQKKTLYELDADFKKGTAATLKFGYSRDYGSTWTERTVSASGSGYGSTRQNLPASNSLEYRFRVYDGSRDESATVVGMTGWARPIPLRQ